MFFKNIYIVIYIYLAVPGLHYFSLVVASRGCPLVAVLRILVGVASLAEHRL